MKTTFLKQAGITLSVAAAISAVAWVKPIWYTENAVENDLIRLLKKRLNEYNAHLPEDRVYLQFDKPMYEPGESIWFSAFVRNGEDLKPSQKSDVLYAELINPKGGVEKTIKLVALHGRAAGDFQLDPEAAGGIYKVKAYTNWQKNDGSFFEKTFQVQDLVLPNLKMKLDFERKAFGPGDEVIAKIELQTNENKPLSDFSIKYAAQLNGKTITEKVAVTDEEGIKYIRFQLPKELKTNDGLLNVMIDYQGNTESVSRSIPIVLNKIDLAFYPEGGEMIAGLPSNVAFKALNEFGKPADVEGEILDSKGKVVSTFESYHMGTGGVSFTPDKNETYIAKITNPTGISETYKLPEVLPLGYTVSVENSSSNKVKINVLTTENEELSLIAQVRGKLYYANAIQAKVGSNTLEISTENFPMGVAQFTLFDKKGIARAERLAFVNKHKKLNVSISTDKQKYLPREKVKLTVNVKDDRGLPTPATFSLAVTNDQLLSFADDKSGNLISQFLLEQDLKQKVEEPSFYFDDKKEKADKALDYLLMTSGWRKFEWEQVAWKELPEIMHQGEKAIISGQILDAYSGLPIENAIIKFGNKMERQTNEKGKFSLKNIDLSEMANLVIKADGYSQQNINIAEYNQNINFYLYPTSYYKYTTRSAVKGVPAIDDAVMEMAMPGEAQNRQVPMVVPNKGKGNNAPMLKKEKNVQKAPVLPQQKALGLNAIEQERKKDNNKNEMGKVAAGAAFDRRFNDLDEEIWAEKPQVPVITYYRARKFAAPEYNQNEQIEIRTDFRNTIFWEPNLEIGKSGKATVEFYASDDITSFRAIAEGIAVDGMIGRSEQTIYTQLPFAMHVKVPVEVATEDLVSIPLTLKNNTEKPLGGTLNITSPSALKALVNIPEGQTIMPGQAKTIYLDYKVLAELGEGEFTIGFKACGLGDAFTQKIKIVAKGFPVTASFSGREVEKNYSVSLNNVVNGSAQATFTAYPNVVSDLMKGVESILREPYGCFEQTSMSSYPNAMVLDYLQSIDSKDEKLLASATGLLDRGYKRLITYETKEKGYEWFGSNPGHEALTAYGLMQFIDMKNVGGKVDQKMIDRTAEWLMNRKDGKGGFQRNALALDNFGRASKEVTDAYIVYALSEAGYTKEIQKEFETAYETAMKSKDAYQMALVSNAAYNMKEYKKGDVALAEVLKNQQKDGGITGASHSITYSTGNSLIIETTSLGLMAMLKAQNKNNVAIQNAVEGLVKFRSGYGGFGNSQGTVLALKSLTEYAKFSKKTNEDGKIEIYVNEKKVADKEYKAGEKDAIVIAGLEKYIGSGKNNIKVKFVGVKDPLPYSLAVSWNTSLPNSDAECVVTLKTKLSSKLVKVGETLRLSAMLTNTKNEGIPSAIALIGIPAGFTAQPWQLKELQEKGVFDYYEIKGNNVALYYRCMAPSAVKEINLDLKAELPGEYEAPASSAYLYYTNEYKCWSGSEKITIKKNQI
ncbi:MAG: hypothetical protein HUU48_12515 [Flavobacteriales bacterium]|nr:hypothetical protein [Flavobacteriales bacterium]